MQPLWNDCAEGMLQDRSLIRIREPDGYPTLTDGARGGVWVQSRAPGLVLCLTMNPRDEDHISELITGPADHLVQAE